MSLFKDAEPSGGEQRLLRVCRLYVFGFYKSFVAGGAALTAAVPHLTVRQSMSIRGEFESFCVAAREADERGSGSVTDFEEQLETLLEFCRGHVFQGHSDEIASCFVALGRGEIPAPYETLMFCMHTLRMNSVLESLEDFHRTLGEGTRRKLDFERYLADIRDAFNPDWPDRDLWRAYDRN